MFCIKTRNQKRWCTVSIICGFTLSTSNVYFGLCPVMLLEHMTVDISFIAVISDALF